MEHQPMKHDPRAFGHKSAGEFLRETIARRRAEARVTAAAAATFALIFSAASGVSMGLDSDRFASLAVLFGLCAALSLIVAVCAASEA
jgi:hypothetical protein